ncbi:MAG: thioesterase family protein [Anaerolineales bacterium]|nr:thioesterase family protein [Anaerolineales bacterium]
MDLAELIKPGTSLEQVFIVDEEKTAHHLGSGESRVLATPCLIAFMERLCNKMLLSVLPEGYSSVGILVTVHHLAPTPVNCSVKVKAEVLSIDGNSVTFSVQAWDDYDQVGAGQHQRAVIDIARFMKRVAAKNHET